jgi:hypothetical protein
VEFLKVERVHISRVDQTNLDSSGDLVMGYSFASPLPSGETVAGEVGERRTACCLIDTTLATLPRNVVGGGCRPYVCNCHESGE